MRLSFCLMAIAAVESIAWDHGLATPTITPAPRPVGWDLRKRQSASAIDPVSLANVLLTAFPESLREMAATNIPAVSKILWSEFLDGSKPAWFTALPTDIQSYLVQQYGPLTASASPTTTQASSSSGSASASSSASSAAPTTKYITTLVTVSAGSIAIPIAAPTTSSTPSSHPSHGLSAGAKIGIGVGVPLAVLAFTAILLACCRLRRRRHRQHTRDSRPPTPGFMPTTGRYGHSTSDDMGQRRPLRGGAGELLSQHPSDSEWNDSGIGGRSYENIPPPVAPYHANLHGSRTSFTSLHSVPEVPEYNEHNLGVLPVPPPRSPRRLSLGDNNNTPPSLIPGGERRRRSSGGAGPTSPLSPLNPAFGLSKFEDTHASYPPPTSLPSEQSGQGIYSEQRNPFSNEHAYVEDYDPAYSNAGGYNNGGHYGGSGGGGGGAWYSHRAPGERAEMQMPANEWPLRNETGGQQGGRKGRMLWDRVYDGT